MGRQKKTQPESEKIYDLILFSDLTDDLVMLSDVVGLDNVRKLIREFNGLTFYIPKIKRLDSFVQRYIEQNPSMTSKEIAKNLQVSETHIKNLLRNK